MSTVTKRPHTPPPWRSQKIWASIVGGSIGIALIILGEREAGLAIIALAGALILGRGLERFGASMLLVLVLTAGSGCGATSRACLAELTTVGAVGAAVKYADEALPDDIEGREEAIGYAEGALELGRAAVDACEAARDDEGWTGWVSLALKAVHGIVSILGLDGVEVPGILEQLLDTLSSMAPADGVCQPSGDELESLLVASREDVGPVAVSRPRLLPRPVELGGAE